MTATSALKISAMGAANLASIRHSLRGTPCGSSSDSGCDAPDTCDGNKQCVDRVDPSGTPCREAQGDCDERDTCDGSSKTCQDKKKASGTSCSDDGNECTKDQCDGSSNSCQHPCEPDGTPCSNNYVCRNCQCGCVVDEDCDYLDDECNLGHCNTTTHECYKEPKANGTSCDDGDGCTVNDRCNAGVCLGTPRDCDDGNPCTDDPCVNGHCEHLNKDDGTPCPYPGPCSGSEVCQDGQCECVIEICGNGVCKAEAGENTCTCPEDCGTRCGDGCCNGNENKQNCPDDCDGGFNVGGVVFSDCDDVLGSLEPGVQVTVSGTGGTVCTTSTDTKGVWLCEDVPAGNYTITLSRSGWRFCQITNPDDCPPELCDHPIAVIVDAAHEQDNWNIKFFGEPWCMLGDMNYNGSRDVIWDVPYFVDCVFWQICNCPEPGCLCPGDFNCDGYLSVAHDTGPFVDCNFWGICPDPCGSGLRSGAGSTQESAGLMIGGLVYDDEANPLFSGAVGVTVEVIEANGRVAGSTKTTEPLGIWTINNLTEGVYRVVFTDGHWRDSTTIVVNAENRAANESIVRLRTAENHQPSLPHQHRMPMRRLGPDALDQND